MSVKNLYPNIEPTLNLSFALTKALDPRVSFTRASTARAYDGKTVAKAEENLLTRSQEFDNAAWVNVNTTETANTTAAPDGTTTADTIIENTDTNQFHQIGQLSTVLAGVPYTFSVYLKANTRSNATLLLGGGANFVFFAFDLSAGTVGSVQYAGSAWSGGTASITNAGNGWYRCSITGTRNANDSSNFFIELNDGATRQYNGNGSSIYAWGAQLEQRSSVTAYTPTTTQPITNYVPVLQSAANNVARFDHNPITGESLGLLIEEQRTNLLLRSEEFDTASWVKTSIGTAAIVANQGISPDGTLSADLYRSSSSGPSVIFQTLSVSSVSHAISVYAKASGVRYFAIRHDLSGTNRNIMFDLENGTIVFTGTGNTATITPVGNGWYRCSTVATASAGTRGVAFKYSTTTISNDSDWTNAGDGFNGVFIWGAQVEAGAFATSYIPTVASQVTRSADAASMTGANFSSWYRADEGTLYVESIARTGNEIVPFVTIDNGANNSNEHRISKVNTTVTAAGDRIVGFSRTNTSLQSICASSSAVSGQFKAAYGYKLNDFAASVNSAAAVTDTDGLLPSVVDRLFIGSRSTLDTFTNNPIRKLSFYPKRLADAELVALTQN